MNNTTEKKLRKYYLKAVLSLSNRDLRKEIFRLARNRDILGIVLILENIVLLIAFFYLYRYFF